MISTHSPLPETRTNRKIFWTHLQFDIRVVGRLRNRADTRNDRPCTGPLCHTEHRSNGLSRVANESRNTILIILQGQCVKTVGSPSKRLEPSLHVLSLMVKQRLDGIAQSVDSSPNCRDFASEPCASTRMHDTECHWMKGMLGDGYGLLLPWHALDSPVSISQSKQEFLV